MRQPGCLKMWSMPSWILDFSVVMSVDGDVDEKDDEEAGSGFDDDAVEGGFHGPDPG